MVSQTKNQCLRTVGGDAPSECSLLFLPCLSESAFSPHISSTFSIFLMFTPWICCATWQYSVFRTSVPQKLAIWGEGCVTELGMVGQLCSGMNTLSRPSSRLGALMCSWSHWGGNCDHLLSLGERHCDESKPEGQWLLAETAHLFPGRPDQK